MMMQLPFKKPLTLLLGLAIVSGWAVPAQAFFKAEDIPPLDRKVVMTKEQFMELTEQETVDNEEDPSLSYRMRLPKGWVTMPIPKIDGQKATTSLFKPLNTYIGPARGDVRSRIEVRQLDVNHFISAQNWFLIFILQTAGTIDGMYVKSDRRVEAQYTTVERGTSFTVRSVVEFSGHNVVIAEYIVPTEFLAEERDQQIWTMISFALTDPDTSPIEPVETYAFVDIVKFDYPQSWSLHSPPVTTIDRMEAAILNLKGVAPGIADVHSMKLNGRVDVRVVSKTLETTEEEELAAIKKLFSESSLEIGDLIEHITEIKFHRLIKKSKLDVYKIQGTDFNLAGYELWVASLESEGRFYILTLITMGREENFARWSQNTESFKYMLRTLSPVNDVN